MIEKKIDEHLLLFRRGFEESPNSQVLAEYREDDVHILHVNKAFTEYYGYTYDEVIGGNPRILNSGKMDLSCFKQMWDAILNPKVGFWREEIINKKKDGQLIHVLLTINTIFENEIPIYFTAYHIDITARKIAEEKAIKAYDQANLYKDIITHDINNILHIINSTLELSSLYITSPEKIEKIKELYEIISEQVIRATNLISNLRKISEIEESGIQTSIIEAENLLKNAINYVEQSYPRRNLRIRLNLPEGKITVRANDLVTDVFENLLINSIRHSGKIDININVYISYFEENYLKFEFQDDGIGIDDERKAFIFERAQDLKKKKQGMGLGLSLVKKIIDSYSGKIWVEDTIKGDHSKGASFVFIIPRE